MKTRLYLILNLIALNELFALTAEECFVQDIEQGYSKEITLSRSNNCSVSFALDAFKAVDVKCESFKSGDEIRVKFGNESTSFSANFASESGLNRTLVSVKSDAFKRNCSVLFPDVDDDEGLKCWIFTYYDSGENCECGIANSDDDHIEYFAHSDDDHRTPKRNSFNKYARVPF